MTEDARLVWEGYLTIEVPSEWSSEENEGVITIYDPDGVGALQFSFASSKTDGVADVEALVADFVRDLKLEAPIVRTSTQLGGVPAAYAEGTDGGPERTYWRVWYACRPGRIVCVTYNCLAANSTVEKSAIDRALATCQLA